MRGGAELRFGEAVALQEISVGGVLCCAADLAFRQFPQVVEHPAADAQRPTGMAHDGENR